MALWPLPQGGGGSGGCAHDCRKLWTLHSCSPSLVVDIPFRPTEADPHGPGFFADHRDSPVAVRFPMVDALLCLSCRFTSLAWRRVCFLWSRLLVGPLRLRSCSTRRIVDVPVVLVVQPPGVSRRAENCGFHSCSSCLVVHMPVVVHDKFGVFLGRCTQVHGQG